MTSKPAVTRIIFGFILSITACHKGCEAEQPVFSQYCKELRFDSTACTLYPPFQLSVHFTRATNGDYSGWFIGTDRENCTLIAMDAVIQHPVFKDVESTIPATAEVAGNGTVDSCDEEAQLMALTWTDGDYKWEISLLFEASEGNYALTNFSGVVEGGGVVREWSYREYSYPSAPLTDSIECNLLILLGGRFENIRWQAFAQNIESGGFGPAYECQILETSGGVKFLFFVILAVTVVAALVISMFNNPARK